MRELFKMLGNAIAAGEDAVLVTVVASSGSTPRGAGARMLITKEGRLRGTIGGGAVEYKSEQLAAEVLKSKSSHLENFRLHPNDVADLGMICGGAVDVYFRYIPGHDASALALTQHIERLFASGEQSWFISNITAGRDGDFAVYGESSGLFGAVIPEDVLAKLSGKPQQISSGEELYYCEELLKAGRVFVFGGGHVAQELVPALSRVGFRCIVLEDRPDFAKPELFEGVEGTRLIDVAHMPEVVADITAEDYVCVMTRGHKDDFEVQRQVLASPARYIGVIGSAGKSAKVFEKLRAAGCTDEALKRITTPIGLDIAAETPAEIAVSITAQLIMVRAGREAGSWKK